MDSSSLKETVRIRTRTQGSALSKAPIGNFVANPCRTHSTKSLTAVEQVSYLSFEFELSSFELESSSNVFRTRTVCSKKLFVDVHLGRKVEYTLANANVLNMLPMADWQRSCQILSYAFYEVPCGCRAGFIPFGKKATIKPARRRTHRKRATRAALGRPFEFERRSFEFETLNGLLSELSRSPSSHTFYKSLTAVERVLLRLERPRLLGSSFELELELSRSGCSSSKEYRSSLKRVPVEFEKGTVQIRKKPMIAAFSQT